MHKLVEMLAYKRPAYSDTEAEFCAKYIRPVFGLPDNSGNYIKVVGHKPNVCFTAHYDTVHKTDGMQKIKVSGDIVTVDPKSGSNCLGADCTTGVYIILEMIKAKVPGTYVIHAAEEIGCVGSTALVQRNPKWLNRTDAVISFDRRGQDSIVTHQMGLRTCSDNFAISLDKILGLGMRPDDTGAYTDSNEYADIISECTNISVGYVGQHTKNESQDLWFLDTLVDSLIEADWSKLEFERDPDVKEYSYDRDYRAYNWGNTYNETKEEKELWEIYDILKDHTLKVAEWLQEQNITATELAEDLDLPISNFPPSFWDNY